MDTIKLLLGATIALLIAAVALSINQTRQARASAPEDRIEQLNRKIEELHMEQKRLDLERKVREQRARELEITASRQPAPEPEDADATRESDEIAAMQARLAESEAALRAIEEEKARAERDAEVYREEAGLAGQREIESSDRDMRRARMIRDALLVARIMEYVDDDEFGGFCTIEILMPENISSGETLAIRRNTGIIGHLRVTTIEGREAVATPLPGFGPVDPQPGDELIIPPPFD